MGVCVCMFVYFVRVCLSLGAVCLCVTSLRPHTSTSAGRETTGGVGFFPSRSPQGRGDAVIQGSQTRKKEKVSNKNREHFSCFNAASWQAAVRLSCLACVDGGLRGVAQRAVTAGLARLTIAAGLTRLTVDAGLTRLARLTIAAGLTGLAQLTRLAQLARLTVAAVRGVSMRCAGCALTVGTVLALLGVLSRGAALLKSINILCGDVLHSANQGQRHGEPFHQTSKQTYAVGTTTTRATIT
jgi:hypothetical protein